MKNNKVKIGKSVEYMVMSRMLQNNLDVYATIADDHGIDCIVKRKNKYYEIQIKGRSNECNCKSSARFTVDDIAVTNNLYFVFYSEVMDIMWLMSCDEFLKESSVNHNGKNKEKRKIVLASYSKKHGFIEKEKYNKYVTNDFSRLK